MTGYFGKVSTHGDFVTRGLPDALVGAWDAWLQACIQASRAQLGDAWLHHYLTSPVWRFAIAPGVLGPEGLGGVMMPSVDRVGRYFPLMIAAVGAPPPMDWLTTGAAWLDAVDDLARASLDPAFTLAQFDGMPEPVLASGGALVSQAPTGDLRFPLDEAGGARVAAAARQGRSLWWTDAAPGVDASLLVCAGMPPAHAFAALLDGAWTASGWLDSQAAAI